MISIKEGIEQEQNSVFTDLLDEQGYTYSSIYNYILNEVTDFYKYPGISLAYDDYSNKYTISTINDYIEDFIDDVVKPKIIELGSGCPQEYSDVVSDLIDNDSDFLSLDNEYSNLVDRKNREDQAERDELNRYYNSIR